MRRNLPHTSVALLTFAIGFLVSGDHEDFIVAMLLALLFFGLVKIIINPNPDLHYLRVALLTLLIWAPVGAFMIHVALPIVGPFACEISSTPTPDSSEEEVASRGSFTEEQNDSSGFVDYSCDGGNFNHETYRAVWAGIVNSKAISLPNPDTPPYAKATNARGTVTVSVIIDGSGMVIWAEPLSGHPLLKLAAKEAACRARFAPTFLNGPPMMASGILIYRFGS